MHGWPDSTRTWLGVAPGLAEAGYRVYIPSLRGFGGTQFLTSQQRRTGQLSSLGRDLIEVADSLGVGRFSVVGHDWGARAAYIAACLWPERVHACVALSVGWGTNNPSQSLSLRQVQNYWYHWYLATERGERLVRFNAKEFTRHIWKEWCPFWSIDEDEFELTSHAFSNPDWADVVLHSYRHRWGLAPADVSCAALEVSLASPPLISTPTLVLHGTDDPCNSPVTSEGKEALFSGTYERRLIERCGHFPQREHPDVVLSEVLGWLEEHRA